MNCSLTNKFELQYRDKSCPNQSETDPGVYVTRYWQNPGLFKIESSLELAHIVH